ncbi:class D beta-lactamase [Corallincola platygyrae]|uniref:Beta-lactamase n=1 Tax=Corallincola platygyrae TaxID=1193278 RepID=A0ABW4XPT5_9GAMM
MSESDINNTSFVGRVRVAHSKLVERIKMKFKVWSSVCIACLIFVSLGAIASNEDNDLKSLFVDNNIDGTMVLSNLNGDVNYIHNKSRAAKRYLPASTFKLPNTLIALQEAAISNEKEVIKWDGKDKGWEPWNSDQTLETALPKSCVWFYQVLAERVGNQRYLSQLKMLDYGNAKTGPELSTFWLDGELAISAMEQVEFLKKLYLDFLPYRKENLELVKRLMIVEQSDAYTIRAKTGWAMRIANQHGWYVGYVETKSDIWFFALNMDIRSKSDAKYRKKIVMDVLKRKRII